MTAKTSVFVICVEAIIYLLLYILQLIELIIYFIYLTAVQPDWKICGEFFIFFNFCIFWASKISINPFYSPIFNFSIEMGTEMEHWHKIG